MTLFFIEAFSNFWIGVASSVVAAFICWVLSIYFTTWRASRGTDIVGSWGEEIASDPQGKCGAGKIYYDKRRKIYAYDGSCYLPDRTKYSQWETLQSYFNRDTKTIYYIYFGKLTNRPGPDHYGFGAVHLSEINAKLTPTSGYFYAPQVDKKTVSHSMFRLPFPYSPDDDGERLLNYLKSTKHR